MKNFVLNVFIFVVIIVPLAVPIAIFIGEPYEVVIFLDDNDNAVKVYVVKLRKEYVWDSV